MSASLPLVLVAPLAALVACVCSRNHGGLIRGGLLLTALAGMLLLSSQLANDTGELGFAVTILRVGLAGLLAAGIVLVLGGLVRWSQSRGR